MGEFEVFQKAVKIILEICFFLMVIYGAVGVVSSNMLFHPLSDDISYKKLSGMGNVERGLPSPPKTREIYMGGLWGTRAKTNLLSYTSGEISKMLPHPA